MKRNVILAMSGGVDSSVALHLLIQNGYKVKGVTMQNGYLSNEDIQKAEQTAKRFNIDWELLSVEKEFEQLVINPFIDYYKKGLTPNPCAICNQTIKLGYLFDKLQEKYPNSYYATGHYAKIEAANDNLFLSEAVDVQKDQSYFLATIRPETLKKIIFPIGNYHKSEIVELGKKLGFVSEIITESQDICFIQGENYQDFLKKNAVVGTQGKFIDENDKVLGIHKGLYHYTIGQRRGLGISYKEKLYVKEISCEANTIKLTKLSNMYSNELTASKLNLFTDQETFLELTQKMLKCKIKSGKQKFDCRIKIHEHELTVLLKENVFAITPGQLCVIYNSKGLIMLSGIIQKNIHKNDENNKE